jgi:hypothetical protein
LVGLAIGSILWRGIRHAPKGRQDAINRLNRADVATPLPMSGPWLPAGGISTARRPLLVVLVRRIDFCRRQWGRLMTNDPARDSSSPPPHCNHTGSDRRSPLQVAIQVAIQGSAGHSQDVRSGIGVAAHDPSVMTSADGAAEGPSVTSGCVRDSRGTGTVADVAPGTPACERCGAPMCKHRYYSSGGILYSGWYCAECEFEADSFVHDVLVPGSGGPAGTTPLACDGKAPKSPGQEVGVLGAAPLGKIGSYSSKAENKPGQAFASDLIVNPERRFRRRSLDLSADHLFELTQDIDAATFGEAHKPVLDRLRIQLESCLTAVLNAQLRTFWKDNDKGHQ